MPNEAMALSTMEAMVEPIGGERQRKPRTGCLRTNLDAATGKKSMPKGFEKGKADEKSRRCAYCKKRRH